MLLVTELLQHHWHITGFCSISGEENDEKDYKGKIPSGAEWMWRSPGTNPSAATHGSEHTVLWASTVVCSWAEISVSAVMVKTLERSFSCRQIWWSPLALPWRCSCSRCRSGLLPSCTYATEPFPCQHLFIPACSIELLYFSHECPLPGKFRLRGREHKVGGWACERVSCFTWPFWPVEDIDVPKLTQELKGSFSSLSVPETWMSFSQCREIFPFPAGCRVESQLPLGLIETLSICCLLFFC